MNRAPTPAHRTAVLVVDMQRDFCHADGAMANLGRDIARNQEVARRLPAFLSAARMRGAMVVWILQQARADMITPARANRARELGRNPLSVCEEGTVGAMLADGLEPQAGDTVMQKWRYSSFIDTPLAAILRAGEIERVVVCGTAANVCVDSTVRDAYQRDLDVTIATDLTGWTDEPLARAALKNLEIYFANLSTGSEILDAWGVTSP